VHARVRLDLSRAGDKRGTKVHESEPFDFNGLGSSSSGSIPAASTIISLVSVTYAA
jgi:hypothetical protein